MESSLYCVCEDFSIQGYKDWSFRIKMCLQAHHVLMWDMIEKGSTPIYWAFDITDSTYVPKVKDPHKYTTKEKKKASLDSYAKGLISSTVKVVHLVKIRDLDTAKEMWDTLKALNLWS